MAIEKDKYWGRSNLIKALYINVQNTKAKPPWTIHIHLKNEGQEGVTGPSCWMVPVGRGIRKA
jgi:hypothetical protein